MRRLSGLALPLFATALVIAMVAHPEAAFRSAVRGLLLWWEVVFPALLPFFVGGQLLMGLGVVAFVGVLLEPLMRPLFNLPGVGGFVTAMGLASGYPIGAVLTSDLRHREEITEVEGERLMSFANTADPLFMAGAVAVGMFGSASVAGTLVAAHYIGAVLTGFVMRFHRPGAPASSPATGDHGPILARAYRALVRARRQDGRPFGRLFGDAVRRSLDTLLLIGGTIILFAVILEILTVAGAVEALAGIFGTILGWFGLSPALGPALVSGTFEITLGSQLAAQADAALVDRLIAAGAIIGWAGLSVHAQVAALIDGTGMSLAPYLLARLVHAFWAGLATGVLLAWGPDLSALGQALAPAVEAMAPGAAAAQGLGWLGRLELGVRGLALAVGTAAAGALLIAAARAAARRLVTWRAP
ncbi:MAG TPA: nucleoside recognition domain-containing protein [Bacillota bacterium]